MEIIVLLLLLKLLPIAESNFLKPISCPARVAPLPPGPVTSAPLSGGDVLSFSALKVKRLTAILNQA